MRVARVETTIVSVPYLHREVSSQVARDGVTDILVRVETDDGAGRLGRGVQRCRRGVGRGGGPRDDAVRARARSVEPRGDAGRPLPARPLAVPRRHRQLRLGRASTWRSPTCAARRCRRAAVPPARRAPAQRGLVLLLPGARRRRRPRGAVRPRPRAGLRDLLPQGRRRRRRPTSRWWRPTRAALGAGPAAAARRERHLERARGAPACSGGWPSTTSTSSSSRSATTRSASWRRCARGCRCRCARTRGCGARPTRTRGSAPGRPTCTASAPTGSARSAPSTGSRTSRTSRGCRSASTRTASSAWPPAAGQHVLLTLPNIVDGHQQTAHVMAARHPGGAAADRGRRRRGACPRAPGWASRSIPSGRRGRPPLRARGPVPAVPARAARARAPRVAAHRSRATVACARAAAFFR